MNLTQPIPAPDSFKTSHMFKRATRTRKARSHMSDFQLNRFKPEEIPQLFQRFARLKRDVSGTVRGTGLGLYVCKQLVEAMHGTIWVESTGVAGEGSRFCFTLELASTDSEQS